MQKFKPLRSQIVVVGEQQSIICPVCEFVLRDSEDVLSAKLDGACTECVTNFKYLNFERWTKGWRPSIDKARAKMHI